MKKMFLGGLLFLCGFMGILALVCSSVFKPWEYNGTGGFGGFLLGSGTRGLFWLCIVLSVVGIAICIHEAYLSGHK